MKKSIMLCITVLLSFALLSGCSQTPKEQSSSDTLSSQSESSSESSEASALSTANDADDAVPEELWNNIPADYPSPVTVYYQGQWITMGLKVVTNVEWESLDTYKSHKRCQFVNGFAVLEFKDEQKGMAYMDSNGRLFDSCPKPRGDSMVINEPEGAEVHVVESAGEYLDQLVDLEGNPLNEELFDHIGDFYQGLGITRRDRKLGLMDNKGNVLIEPIFPFDKTEYPGSTWKFRPQVLNEDLLLIPIDGKVGIIKITRS